MSDLLEQLIFSPNEEGVDERRARTTSSQEPKREEAEDIYTSSKDDFGFDNERSILSKRCLGRKQKVEAGETEEVKAPPLKKKRKNYKHYDLRNERALPASAEASIMKASSAAEKGRTGQWILPVHPSRLTINASSPTYYRYYDKRTRTESEILQYWPLKAASPANNAFGASSKGWMKVCQMDLVTTLAARLVIQDPMHADSKRALELSYRAPVTSKLKEALREGPSKISGRNSRRKKRDSKDFSGFTHSSRVTLNNFRLSASIILAELGDLQSSESTKNTVAGKVRFQETWIRAKRFFKSSESNITATTLYNKDLSVPKSVAVQMYQALLCSNVDNCAMEVAEELELVGTNEYSHDPQIDNFAQIHFTTGTATLASRLSCCLCLRTIHDQRYIADIIANGCNDYGIRSRTPVDVIKNVLITINEVRSVSFSISHREQVKAAFAAASSIFKKCVALEPKNMVYVGWKLACTCGALIVCSGVPPRCSSKIDERLPDFYFYRREFIREIVELDSVAMSQCNHRSHSILVSICEWTELVFVASRYLKLSGKDNIHVRKFHAWHSLQWALNDLSAFSFDSVRSLWSSNEISIDAYASVLATRIEGGTTQDVQLDLLTELATKVLGRVGYDLTTYGDETSCNRYTCKECRRLNVNLFVPHRDLRQRKKEGKWWGLKRKEWWQQTLLTNPFLRRKHPHIYDNVRVRQGALVVCYDVSKHTPQYETVDATFPGAIKPQAIDCVFNKEEIHTRWMDEPDILDDESDEEADGTNNMTSSSAARLGSMPKATANEKPAAFAMPELQVSKLPVRILTLKIVVAAHLFGVDHEFVGLGVYSLAQSCHIGDSQGDEFSALVWLSYCFGFNVQEIVYRTMEERVVANTEGNDDAEEYTFLAVR